MATPVATAHDTVHAAYHLFWLAEEIPSPGETPRSNNGLVDAVPGAAAVVTGIHTGVVGVTVEFHENPPEVEDDGWDEVVESTIWSHDGELRVYPMMADFPRDLPTLSFNGPGAYRIRVHAAGRDINPDGTADEPSERYLLQLWSTDGDEFDPEVVHKQTDRFGASWRAARTG